MHIGRHSTHPTHHLASYKGLIYCVKCGSYTTSRHIIKLSRVCRPRTQHGERALAAIHADRLPLNVHRWPIGPNVPGIASGRVAQKRSEPIVSLATHTPSHPSSEKHEQCHNEFPNTVSHYSPPPSPHPSDFEFPPTPYASDDDDLASSPEREISNLTSTLTMQDSQPFRDMEVFNSQEAVSRFEIESIDPPSDVVNVNAVSDTGQRPPCAPLVASSSCDSNPGTRRLTRMSSEEAVHLWTGSDSSPANILEAAHTNLRPRSAPIIVNSSSDNRPTRILNRLTSDEAVQMWSMLDHDC